MTHLQTIAGYPPALPPQTYAAVFLFDDPVTEASVLVTPGWLPSALACYLKAASVSEWAILSASDAHGFHLDTAENGRRGLSLYRHLRLSGYEPVQVWSKSGAKAWLVPGLNPEEAKRFGRLFAQSRVLVGDGLSCRLDACEPLFFDI